MKENNDDDRTCITQTKNWRRDLDAILQEMKTYQPCLEGDGVYNGVYSIDERNARNAAVQRLSESIMWCGMILKSLGTPNPYPNSKDPSNTTVDPTADGLKL